MADGGQLILDGRTIYTFFESNGGWFCISPMEAMYLCSFFLGPGTSNHYGGRIGCRFSLREWESLSSFITKTGNEGRKQWWTSLSLIIPTLTIWEVPSVDSGSSPSLPALNLLSTEDWKWLIQRTRLPEKSVDQTLVPNAIIPGGGLSISEVPGPWWNDSGLLCSVSV